MAMLEQYASQAMKHTALVIAELALTDEWQG